MFEYQLPSKESYTNQQPLLPLQTSSLLLTYTATDNGPRQKATSLSSLPKRLTLSCVAKLIVNPLVRKESSTPVKDTEGLNSIGPGRILY